MSKSVPLHDGEVINVGPPQRRRWRRWLIGAIVVLFIILSRSLSIYLSATWFSSLGFSAVYWYIFKLKIGLFLAFALLTLLILRTAFWLLERTFASQPMAQRTIVLNNQPIQFSPARFVRPLGWIIAGLFGFFYGLGMKAEWQTFALYFNQAPAAMPDPIFNKPLGFYLFSLPVYDLLSGWLLVLAFVILCAAIVYSLLALPQSVLKIAGKDSSRKPFSAISFALALFLVLLAWRTYLSRFPYLWEDHQTFSGVSFAEANYLLPALYFVCVALLLAAVIAVVNAVAKRGLRLLLVALAIPLAVYVIGAYLVPAYVTSFIVKPNELGRETPYIEQNIAWTRRAFGLEQVELREFQAEGSVEALDLNANRPTLDNIRLWDWHALQDTLKQIQAIRTYYDFPDVDVDRYRVDGIRQMMVAAREIDVKKLPEASQNWINEKLIYTHGYGVTVNTANGFTPEGMPRFIVSDMPVQSNSAEIKVTRPEIYYGQETNTDVYVKTRQKEFDYPQGETNTFTSYEGTGGIRIGGRARRMLLAWALGDLSKLPFSDDVNPESRVLIHRNIRELVNGIAPFLTYDNDPYIVVSNEGRLFWIIDAFTESATYPYSRHHTAGTNNVNYIRNSVKVVIDAYNGSVTYYIFDNNDPLIATYRATFPTLFQDASQMPADLRAHVRYPETLIRVQGDVYGLYHTQSAKVFFQREDVWNIAQQVGLDEHNNKQVEPIDPYFVLMQLPGEQTHNEFVLILPFTPFRRNNLIGWMAGRCDGDNYGKLLIYNFPKSRLIDGPLQIEARIDQNSQLSSQFTLWNQQGSHVLRGHLLVIPIGNSLLYVEPIYLKAESSPMPELRMVVLATQDRLGYGPTFNDAMVSLFGESGRPQASEKSNQPPEKPAEGTPKASPSPGPAETPAVLDVQQLINRAVQEFDEYQRLTSQGKLGEAGQKLEQHKRTLEELKKVGSKKP
ncbi:MAG TPA: UPF0182 family protein [Pyrinomonadaceae bacterium]|nr:UPF0182 family protein [Pyrinomonadaceae bacterium]